MSPAAPPAKRLPSRLYVIADAETLAARRITITQFGVALRAAGVRLIQYRDKKGTPHQVLNAAMALRDSVGHGPCVILNDRADLATLANVHGVHIGQSDIVPAAARHLVGPDSYVGVSAHTDDQVRAADATTADYIAIGPVFATSTKADLDPIVGLEGVRRARALTSKPLVAIGGITRQNALSVAQAGADAVAVISALFVPGESVENVARDFLHILR